VEETGVPRENHYTIERSRMYKYMSMSDDVRVTITTPKRAKEQIIICKTLHRKLKMEQHELH
jgi:hypothetical protein